MAASGVRDVNEQAADNEQAGALLGAFLDRLARDIAARPGAAVPLDEAFFARIDALTGGVAADPDEPIEGEAGL
jgi:hypothetical protein